MLPGLPRDASFWLFLYRVDKHLAESTRQRTCSCGGRLHRANYLRKPRGVSSQLPKECCYRLSFCCNRDGCRKRVTPPSVRFLDRKVYLAGVVVLVAAMRQGPSPRRVRELSQLFGVDRRTIGRWQVFWQEHFPQTPFWKLARGRLAPAVPMLALPYSLVQAFVTSDRDWEGWKRLLCFLSPISTAGGLSVEFSG